jgi:activator of HSP90 ATPase
MRTKTIKQKATFDATPDEVYQLIMDEKKHAAFTGTKVKMSTKVDGKFDVFNGYIKGYNIELMKGRKIVQAWYFAEEGWPDNYFTICTFLFEEVDGKTKMTFVQTGVPEEHAESLKEGWKEYYWVPMKAYLKNN